MVNTQRIEEFWRNGFTTVPQAINSELIEEATASLWGKLAASGIRRNEPDTWHQPKPKNIQSTSKTSMFNALFEGTAQQYLDALLGKEQWNKPSHWGQVLLSLPTDHQWHVPSNMWHLDMPEDISQNTSQKRDELKLLGVQLFIYLEDVTEKCGATVVISGSHHLVDDWFKENGIPTKRASSLVQNQLAKEHDWFKKLKDGQATQERDEYLMEKQTTNQFDLQVCELKGKRGDMILMHPFLLHAPAPNIGPNLRLAVTQRVYSSIYP